MGLLVLTVFLVSGKTCTGLASFSSCEMADNEQKKEN